MSRGWKVILIIVVLAALIGGGWYAWQKLMTEPAGEKKQGAAPIAPVKEKQLLPVNIDDGTYYAVDPTELAPGGYLHIGTSSADTGGFYSIGLEAQKAWMKSKGYSQLAV